MIRRERSAPETSTASAPSVSGPSFIKSVTVSIVSPSIFYPWTVVHLASLTMEFLRQEYWSGLPCPSPGHLPDPGIEPASLVSPSLAGAFFSTSVTDIFVHFSSGISGSPGFVLQPK